jgi:hypothetical protein
MDASFFTAARKKLREDYGFVGVGEDAVVEVPTNGAREDEALEVAALLDKVG